MTNDHSHKRTLMLAVSDPKAIGGQAACARMLLTHFDDVEWTSLSFPLPNQYGPFMRLGFSISMLFRALWICMTKKIDVVHILTACGRSALFEKLIIARILKLTGVKVVVNFQGAFDYYYSTFSNRDRRWIKKLLRAPDVILCLHTDMEKFLVENEIASAEKMRVIPNAVPTGSDIIKNKSITGEIRMTYLGWLVANKGLHTLVEAAGILVNQYKAENFLLTIIGPEVEHGLAKKLLEKANTFGVQGNIKILPPVFGEEKRNVFASTDIFVFPTRMEGFPFVLLEAMEAGLAVVTTDISPMNLIVKDDVTGLLFEKDNAAGLASGIHRLIMDEMGRKRIGSGAKSHVEANFSLGKIISMYRLLYSGL